MQHLWNTLSPDEWEKAGCFRFKKDRQHFIAARGILRDILSRYLSVEPKQLRFRYSPFGKPALAGAFEEENLRFNLAHSSGLGLYAFSRGREVGVDVEYIREELSSDQVAEMFFSSREVAELRSLSGAVKTKAFFDCWTRKEAYLKARGEGLSLPLDQFDVSLAPGEPPRLKRTRDDPREASRWSLKELSPGPGYVASIVVEERIWSLQCWQWPAPL